MANNKSTFYIQRIKLVNFHNISNVTIPITPNGHLFLLGDNGSGKTTVLDAIHYVLTAGLEVELNAAARFGGNKKEGRRINEVISCYNVDTGHKYQDGRVTYAILELQSTGGNPVSIGMGLSLTDVNAQVMKWGFIADVPIDEIPILGKDENGLDYALPRDEFRNALEAKNMHTYYRSPEAYSNALAKRFFPNADQYRDYCHFLFICKAYREICSHAGNNYQLLFKQLLPDPEVDIFEKLQVSMRNLNESQNALLGLEKRYYYICAITAQLHEIVEATRNKVFYSAMSEHIAEYKSEEECVIITRRISEFDKKRNETEDKLAGKKRERQSLEHQMENLKSQDASGLLRQEKQNADELELKNKQKKHLTEQFNNLKAEHDKETERYDGLLKELRSECEKLALKLTTESGKLAGLNIREVLEDLNRVIEQGNLTCDIPLVKLNGLSSRIIREKIVADAKSEQLKKQLETDKKEFEEQKQYLDNLKSSKEAEPEIPGYSILKNSLDNAQLDWTPLYLKLHWRSGLGEKEKGEIEEFIGERVLATVIARDDSYTMAEMLVFEESNGLRLAQKEIHAKAVNPATIEWLNQFFDSDRDGKYLDILALELDAELPPEFGERHGCGFVSFRSYLAPLSGGKARLIGEDARIKEQQRLIAEAEINLKEMQKWLKKTEENLKAFNTSVMALTHFDKRFTDMLEKIRGLRDSSIELDRGIQSRVGKILIEQTQLDELQGNISKQDIALKELRKQIVLSNIHDLETRLADLGEQIARIDGENSNLDQQIGGFISQIKRLQEDYSGFQKKIEEHKNKKQDLLNELKGEYQFVDPQDEIKKRMSTEHIHTVETAQLKVEHQKNNVIIAQATIESKIQEIEGKDLGLRFEKELNQVFARDNRNISDMERTYKSNLDQQKQIINEDSSRMFKEIVMRELREALQRRVFKVEEMARIINRRLEKREFGESVYSIHIKELPKYEHLVKMLKNSSVYDQDEADELRFFFETNSVEILNTPPGRIPDLLDYRNWYQYDIKFGMKGSDGTIISSRIKSVRSGGEQAVPNYLLIMMIAYFLFEQDKMSPDYIRINSLLFDEAFYGIDDLRREQLMGFASDLGLQLFIASPNQDGVKSAIPASTTIFVLKDKDYNVHFYPCHWKEKYDMLDDEIGGKPHFGEELS